MGETQRRYTHFVNARARWSGHLFQSRFASVAMDDSHLIAAARYVSLNPVRARLVSRADDWRWSSVRAHLSGRDDKLVTVKPLLDRVGDFSMLLRSHGDDEPRFAALRSSEGTGRPLGNVDFIAGLDKILGRPIARRALGRKAAMTPDDQLKLL